MLNIPFISGCQKLYHHLCKFIEKYIVIAIRPMQVSFKIRNQLAIKPEIFTEGIAKLVGEDDLFLGTTFRVLNFKSDRDIMIIWWYIITNH